MNREAGTWDEYFAAVERYHIFQYGGYGAFNNLPVTQEEIDSIGRISMYRIPVTMKSNSRKCPDYRSGSIDYPKTPQNLPAIF